MYKSIIKLLSIISVLLIFVSIELCGQYSAANWAEFYSYFNSGSANRTITLTANITVDTATVRYAGNYPITITGGASVKRITGFPGGPQAYAGGALFLEGNVTFINIEFYRFVRWNAHAGAMNTNANTIAAFQNNIYFTSNTVWYGDDSAGGTGGGIENGGVVNFTNASNIVFSANSAWYRGGAIYNYEAGIVNFTGTTAKFTLNAAYAGSSPHGGAIFTMGVLNSLIQS
jgi:predicted outer membrane repeat protein